MDEKTYEGHVTFADGSVVSLQCFERRPGECPGILPNGCHCEGSCPELADTVLDTNQILADLGRAETILTDTARHAATQHDDESCVKDLIQAAENFRDQWAYLRHCLEAEHAPLPDAWTQTPADVQLTHLRRAALAYGEYLEANPQLTDESNADTPCGVLAAKGDHLAACAAAVDAMCCEGDLPRDWTPP